MAEIKCIDVESLDINKCIEEKFLKKDVYVRNVEIKDVNKIVITRRKHSDNDRNFLAVRLYENDKVKGTFTTDFKNIEFEDWDTHLYIRRERSCI